MQQLSCAQNCVDNLAILQPCFDRHDSCCSMPASATFCETCHCCFCFASMLFMCPTISFMLVHCCDDFTCPLQSAITWDCPRRILLLSSLSSLSCLLQWWENTAILDNDNVNNLQSSNHSCIILLCLCQLENTDQFSQKLFRTEIAQKEIDHNCVSVEDVLCKKTLRNSCKENSLPTWLNVLLLDFLFSPSSFLLKLSLWFAGLIHVQIPHSDRDLHLPCLHWHNSFMHRKHAAHLTDWAAVCC